MCSDNLLRRLLSPPFGKLRAVSEVERLPGLVGSNAPFHGLTPVATFYRASGAGMLVRNTD